jgi:hypothetical protein
MKYLSVLFLFFVFYSSFAQTGQINISRVEQMPNHPAPYLMLDWKEVATQYDAFIFNQDMTGTYLPVLTLKATGRNYPELKPIQLDTYVGTTSSTQAEAINIIPSIVSASLMGIDKSNQNGVNWVEKIKDFYNSANGQNVYLNGSNSSSGNDWWYDLMPNVFFYQVYDLYPATPGFENQFQTVADQWLKAVYAMGGKSTPWTAPNMNYRGWYLSSMTGNTEGVKEPESAGTIGWLLYQAYLQTGDEKYLKGAEMSIEYLASLNSNPSYELQLPYGTLTAAKLNAGLGTNYDISKMLNWSFNKGALRGWGTIVGKWDGKDVSGLVGEANDQGNDYAFLMNGFQQAGALVPLVKYDKRFSRAIAKWVLNLANASRLLYPQFLSSDKQDDFAWSNEFDPQSVIGYEALKENWEGKALYGTGDAKRNSWAATNLALYGSSHSGYLAAIVETTDVEEILKLDLNKTDFFADNFFPTYLLFNPYSNDQQVTLNLGAEALDLYDAISETKIAQNVSGNYVVQIKADEVLLLTYLPSGTQTSVLDGKLYADSHIIDYHPGYNFNPRFRLKELAAKDEVLEYNDITSIYAAVENAPSSVSYHWFINETPYSETTIGQLDWTAPALTGENEIKVEVHSEGLVLKDSLVISVMAVIPTAPVFTSIVLDKKFYGTGTEARIIAQVQNANTEKFSYEWIIPAGSVVQDDSLIVWTTPSSEGLYTISCIVKNKFDLTAQGSVTVLVKAGSTETTSPLAYYPLNIDVNDYSGNNYHAHVEGTQEASDALNLENFAYRFSSEADLIYVSNNAAFNFTDAITLSFWISPRNAGHEAFILSHGSWEERWKISITPEKKLRWTVKTDSGVKDLDSTQPVVVDQFVHVTVVYTGYSMEMYLDGTLDGYLSHNGLILTTEKAVTFGQKNVGQTLYYYNGVLDEVRVYDKSLQPDEISLLKTLWREELPTGIEDDNFTRINVYPNPAANGEFWISHAGIKINDISLVGAEGRIYPAKLTPEAERTKVSMDQHHNGLYFLKITAANKVKYLKVVIN